MKTEITGTLPVVNDLTETFNQIAQMMQKSTDLNFETGGRPQWPPLKYRTGKPLVLTGALKASLLSGFGPDHAEVIEGRGIVYAAIHQFGGTVHPKVTEKMRAFYWAKWFETKEDKWRWMALGAKVGTQLNITIPARPSLVWLPEDVEQYTQMLGNRMITLEDVTVTKQRRLAA